MKKIVVILLITGLVAIVASFTSSPAASGAASYEDSLRALYARPITEWPKPLIQEGVQWKELSALPVDSHKVAQLKDPKIQLGKLLFFDPRLSGSNQISCSSCHDPDLSWTDGRTAARRAF